MRPNQSKEKHPSNSLPLLKESPLYQVVAPPRKLPWQSRWLKGHEYGFMLRRMQDYCIKFGLQKYKLNQHPEMIYQQPENGSLYFMNGNLLQKFGFPRSTHKKKYCWKKMNFRTNLPKSQPETIYIVASTYPSASQMNQGLPEYRMHVVVLVDLSVPYLICHIRRITGQKAEEESCAEQLFQEGKVNLYRLFLHSHNLFNSL